jgi:hypothetical protein
MLESPIRDSLKVKQIHSHMGLLIIILLITVLG